MLGKTDTRNHKDEARRKDRDVHQNTTSEDMGGQAGREGSDHSAMNVMGGGPGTNAPQEQITPKEQRK